MTDERITLPGITDDQNRTLGQLIDQLNAKAPRNLLRASYYDGKRAIRQIGTIIPAQYYRLGLVLGWTAKAVDLLARRCNLDSFVWPEGDLSSIGADEVWTENRLDSEIDQAEVSSLIHSVTFAINTRGLEGEAPGLIHFKDARNATGTWNGRTRRLDNLLSVTARDREGKITGLALYLFNLTIVASQIDGRWTVEQQKHSWGVPAEPMVYRPRLGREFGSSRISRTLMVLQDSAVREWIRLEGHMDIFSQPEMILLGADESAFKNPDGTQKASWQIMLGRIKGIPDDASAPPELARADVKRFDAASPGPHLDMLKQQAMMFSGESSIPLTSLGVSDMSNPTSADSYIASREDLIAEAEGAMSDWSPALRRSFVRALAMKNDLTEIPPEWQSIAPKWRSPLYLSRAAAADAGAKQLGTVPWLSETEVGLELLGLDNQQIQRAMAEKRKLEGRRVLTALTSSPAAGGSPQ